MSNYIPLDYEDVMNYYFNEGWANLDSQMGFPTYVVYFFWTEISMPDIVFRHG